jgi:hypothetical protein
MVTSYSGNINHVFKTQKYITFRLCQVKKWKMKNQKYKFIKYTLYRIYGM